MQNGQTAILLRLILMYESFDKPRKSQWGQGNAEDVLLCPIFVKLNSIVIILRAKLNSSVINLRM